jgi:glycine betaine/choline ABC-type transport system substrate-binding protein
MSALVVLVLAGCGATHHSDHTLATLRLPGTGKPPVTIGDKNFTEQFILGELYYYALRAQGYSVQLSQNIGPLEVTLQDLRTGQLAMYPEYLNVWVSQVAHQSGPFATRGAAYQAGQAYATAHGLRLLDATPFSDTTAVGVTFNYAVQHGLSTIWDLRRVERGLALGGPPEFQQESHGLPALESAYGLTPRSYKPLEIGGQYQALQSDQVQAAVVSSTDAQLSTGDYTLLGDPQGVFPWGNVIPVVSAKVLAAEGPAFATTINEVSALLTTPVIRELNAQVDLSGQDPATVATQFLAENGVT